MNQEVFQIVATLFGGLAVFIYGMNLMSDGLQKAAGEKMRSILSMLTANPILGVIAGALVTAVIQSSSATTVMVIGFVSAGLMQLPQAISIILGANIGTTITAQIVAFSIGDLAWLFVFIGFVMFFFLKKYEKIHDIGEILFGFGLLFVGINTMSAVMKPLAHAPLFANLMMEVADSPVLGVLVGTVMTAVVQSSSASIAVLQNLASTAGPDGVTSIIGLTGALPILFGTNIGTTITAAFASIGASFNAKRTAVAHTIFNVFGTLIFMFFIPQIVWAVGKISPVGPEIEIISRQIANGHLLFNFVNTLIFLPFIWLLVKIVVKVVPGEDKEIIGDEPKFLDYHVIEQPVFATHLAIQELSRNASIAKSMMLDAKYAFMSGDLEKAEDVYTTDDTVNKLRTKTIEYLSSILAAESITEYQKERVAALLHVASDIEHIGDYAKNIVDLATDKSKKKYEFSTHAVEEIEDYFARMETMLDVTIEALETGDIEKAYKVIETEETINNLEDAIRKEHMERVSENLCAPAVTVVFLDAIHNIERAADSCTNIAEAVIKGYDHKNKYKEEIANA